GALRDCAAGCRQRPPVTRNRRRRHARGQPGRGEAGCRRHWRPRRDAQGAGQGCEGENLMRLLRPAKAPRRDSVAAVLDLGSTKAVCLVARLTPIEEGKALRGRGRAIDVLGYAHQRSRCIKSGVVANLEAAEETVRHAVDAAEKMAGVTVGSL